MEGECAFAAPGSAVVEEDDIPAGASQCLGQIEVSFIAWKAMEQKSRGVGARAAGFIDNGIHGLARALEASFPEERSGLLAGGRVRGDGVEGRFRPRAGKTESNEEQDEPDWLPPKARPSLWAFSARAELHHARGTLPSKKPRKASRMRPEAFPSP